MLVSGRYVGVMTAPSPGLELLDLRVDVDALDANSPVTDRVSGDIFCTGGDGAGAAESSRHRHSRSWIVDVPQVVRNESQVEITGAVRFWDGRSPAATIHIHLNTGDRSLAAALTSDDGRARRFACTRQGDGFRRLELHVDACRRAGTAVHLPEYAIGSHENRPSAVAPRRLTIASALREAGIDLSLEMHPAADRVDGPERWSDEALRAALVGRLGCEAAWPRWRAWGLLAGRHEDPRTGGLMFDTAAPARRGFAVFRDHPWFALLADREPQDDLEAAAQRKYLFTWVHEIGHTLNLVHSSEKGRPDSPSWMNHEGEYDARNGGGSFWRDFHFRFDDEELIHLRHGDLTAVIMGGDSFRSGAHLRSCALFEASARRREMR